MAFDPGIPEDATDTYDTIRALPGQYLTITGALLDSTPVTIIGAVTGNTVTPLVIVVDHDILSRLTSPED